MQVKDMNLVHLKQLCKTRQEVLGKKYGDADKTRDTSKDLIEEISDIINISNRRWKWINESEIITTEERNILAEKIHKLQNQARILFLDVVDFDKAMKKTDYIEDDIKRIWFDEVDNESK